MASNEYNFEDPNDEKVAAMLGSLARVEAPADFDARLKARIARGATVARPAFGAWLRYAAMPVFLAVLAGVLFLSGMFNAPEQLPTVAVPVPEKMAEPAAASMIPKVEIPREVARDTTTIAAPTPIDAVSRTPVVRRERPTARVRESGSLSFDTGLGITNKVIQPRGIPVDPRVVGGNSAASQTGGVSVKELLSALGVVSERSTAGWTVKNVTAKSQAERSGVQAFDVIEAVGKYDVKGKDSLQGSVSVDSFTVIRGGKRVVIKLAGR